MSSSPLESFVEARIIRDAQKRGWWQVKIMKTSKKGVMDRVFIRRGRVVWMELKRFGKEPNRQQELRAEEMRAHGAEVHWVDNYDDAMRILA